MYDKLKNLDRRWIFLLMFLSVAIPIIIIGITGQSFPEKPTDLAYSTFNAIEDLKPGDKVLLSFDFDPASEGELGPMATAFTYHCAANELNMYFMALWPVGPQMIDNAIENVIKKDFPDLVYGEDYVNLGFKSGGEGVIKVIVTDFLELFSTDAKGTPFNDIPMNKEISSVQDMDLVINISAGSAGQKSGYSTLLHRTLMKLHLLQAVREFRHPSFIRTSLSSFRDSWAQLKERLSTRSSSSINTIVMKGRLYREDTRKASAAWVLSWLPIF